MRALERETDSERGMQTALGTISVDGDLIKIRFQKQTNSNKKTYLLHWIKRIWNKKNKMIETTKTFTTNANTITTTTNNNNSKEIVILSSWVESN